MTNSKHGDIMYNSTNAQSSDVISSCLAQHTHLTVKQQVNVTCFQITLSPAHNTSEWGRRKDTLVQTHRPRTETVDWPDRIRRFTTLLARLALRFFWWRDKRNAVWYQCTVISRECLQAIPV